MTNNLINRGFTLSEFIVTVTILAILASLAIPLLLPTFKRMESQTIANEIMNFLTSSKQSALIYQNTVTACIANDEFQCVLSGGKHLISFIDKNGNHIFDANLDQLHQKIDLSTHFGNLTTTISANKAYIELKPDNGRPLGYIGNIKYCPDDGELNNAFKITFNKVGGIKYKTNQDDATNCV